MTHSTFLSSGTVFMRALPRRPLTSHVSEQSGKIMYPEVTNYGDIEMEPFESYYSRWPGTLSSIPKPIVEDWIYRHWRDFSEHWINLNPHKWSYELLPLPTSAIIAVDHIGTWIHDLDSEGVEYVGGAPRSKTKLARFMLANGTFPVPIIVAKNAGTIIHPRSKGEFMKEPYQLIEGHCRLACIRGMINSKHPNLLDIHNVWVVTIPNQW